MPLAPATRLGPFEIVSAIGAGGMGEVYRARDTRLGRIVAVKILPTHLSSNPQSRERFEREAKAISSLSHPHICALYDVGHQDGIDFLVMEYLEGETLARRLKKGPLAPEQVLQYAIQITDALDTAHKHGVIHRDLKPGNIMLTKAGAKLLDFGLAKVRGTEAVAGMTHLPTETTPLTAEGTILGTLQYMAPEQLEGTEADARTDIFALGAVIYEMATGRKAFEGKSQASLISAIMTAEPPPISTLQALTPPALDHVVRTCLAKEPDARWQTAHDVLVELRWLTEAGSQAGVPGSLAARHMGRRELIAWAIVALLTVALAVDIFRQRPAEARTVRFQVPLPDRMSMSWFDFPVISPDGRRLLLPGIAPGGIRHLWLRSLDSLDEQLLPGTDEAYFPFWSPDSRSLAFFANEKLKRIDLAGGTPRVVCDAKYPNGGGTWNRDGSILFSDVGGSGILVVSATGGQPKRVLELDRSRQEIAELLPQFLPDGRHFLYLSQSVSAGKGGIYTGSLDSKETRLLLAAESNASYAPPGFLVYGVPQTLLAQPFDPNRLRASGEAVPIAERVGRMTLLPASLFSVSQNGVLVYGSPGYSQVQLAWHNRDGMRKALIGEPGIYLELNLSPGEKRLAVTRTNSEGGTRDLWILDLPTGILSRLTLHASEDPQWSPDSRELVYSSNQKGKLDLYRKVVGGGNEELVFQSEGDKWAQQWFKDGSILFEGESGKVFYRLPLSGERKPVVLLETEFDKDNPRVSPDERWVAYQSTESGRWEVYVASFPSFEEKRQVSNDGGCQPQWRRDGKELFYLGLQGKMMSVEVKGGPSLETNAPKILFQTPLRVDPTSPAQYVAAGDGERFVFGEPVGESSKPVTILLNWTAGLKR